MTQTNYDILKEYEEHQEPIPTYRELQQLKKFCEEFNALNVSKENQKLKELLKECKEYIDGIDWNVDNREFFAKIDEVLND